MKARKSYKRKKMIHALLTASISAVGFGSTVGLGPIALPILAVAMAILSTFAGANWGGKIETTQKGEKDYENKMLEIKKLLRSGEKFDEKVFFAVMKEFEIGITDRIPDLSKMKKKYEKWLIKVNNRD